MGNVNTTKYGIQTVFYFFLPQTITGPRTEKFELCTVRAVPHIHQLFILNPP